MEKLWMSSNYGIVQFDKKTHRIKGYNKNDGITHNEFNRASHHRDEDGYIYFGGLNGVTAFHPKDFYEDTLETNVELVITEFQQFDGKENKLIDKTSELAQNKIITLLPSDRFSDWNLPF